MTLTIILHLLSITLQIMAACVVAPLMIVGFFLCLQARSFLHLCIGIGHLFVGGLLVAVLITVNGG